MSDTKYMATWTLSSERHTAEADTLMDLMVKVFGRAYAPYYKDVHFWQAATSKDPQG